MFKIGNNPTNTLWSEPSFPRDILGKPYDFSVQGDGITRKLILSALVPKSPDGRNRWGHVHVLDVLHHRLFRANKRNNRKNHPAFGDYMYTWDNQDVLAMQAGMPVTSLRNNLNHLEKWGIVYKAQANKQDANSYRLTDSAFKMAQTLQTFALFFQWQHHVGPENTLFSGQQWDVFVRVLDDLPRGLYQTRFTQWIGAEQTQNLIAQWHLTNDGTGQKMCPSQLGIRAYALQDLADFLAEIEALAGDENTLDLSNPKEP